MAQVETYSKDALLHLVDIDLLQRLQDGFSDTTGIASIIYTLDGTPLTKGSNFCEYCNLIRSTPKGLRNCMRSDEEISRRSFYEIGTAMKCLSGCLMDGIAPIVINGKRIASWGVGQVGYQELDLDWVRWYAQDIGIDEKRLVEASQKIQLYTPEQFKKKINYLITLSQEISEMAFVNHQLTQEISNRRKSETRYRAIVKNAIVGVCEITNTGKIDFVNSHLSKMSGYTEEELIGLDLSAILVSEKDFNSYINGNVEYLQNSHTTIGYDFTGKLLEKIGTCRPCRVCMTPQVSLTNQIIKSTAVIIDISVEKKATDRLIRTNRELEESKKQSDMFFDNNINGLCAYDQQLNQIKANTAFQVFMQEYSEHIGADGRDILHEFGMESIHDVLSGVSDEVEIKREYGLKLYSLKLSPFCHTAAVIYSLLVIITDITDYHMMLENALFSQKMSGVGMIASGIAHDMKSVFSILGNSNSAMKSLSQTIDNQEVQKNLSRMLQTQELGLQNGRKLLTQIFSYSGSNQERVEMFSLQNLAEKTIRIYNSEVLNKNATVLLDIDPMIQVVGSYVRFSQIFMNLIGNALDAIDTHGTLWVSAEYSEDVLIITFKDSGDGIPEENIDNVFHAFYTTKKDGTGLGLFLVKNIVHELHGRCSVESNLGDGTVFTIVLGNSELCTIQGVNHG